MNKEKLTGRGGPGRNQGRRPIHDKPMKRVSVMLDEDTLKTLDQLAVGSSRSAILRKLINLCVTVKV